MSPASGSHVNRPPWGVAELRARTLLEPLAESAVDGVLVRVWMLTPQVLAHEIHARVEQEDMSGASTSRPRIGRSRPVRPRRAHLDT